uniref:Uncharacterized protein n=1 Tax=Solanum tuberosum TaxID=4113 RepID=M1DVH3_SOLTU
MEPPPREARDETRKTLNPPVPPDGEEISQNQILVKEEVGGKCKLENMDKNISFKDMFSPLTHEQANCKIIGGPGWGYDGRKTFGKHRDKPNGSKAREQGNK